MKANPKTVWVMLNNHEPYYVDKKESFSLTEGWSCVPYHLHPGNEVKLKRENAAMRKWIIQENGGQRSAKKCPCLRCKKLREVVTDL